MKRTISLIVLVACGWCFGSCGGSPHDPCDVTVQMTPVIATLDHLSVPPANGQTFRIDRTLPEGCVQAMFLPQVTWTSSDPLNAPVTPQTTGQNSATAVASCSAATTAIITGSFTPQQTATATLTCR